MCKSKLKLSSRKQSWKQKEPRAEFTDTKSIVVFLKKLKKLTVSNQEPMTHHGNGLLK